MSDSNLTSKKSISQHNFNIVDSKKSLRTDNNKEQLGIDNNIHNMILSDFHNSQNLKVIREKENEELNLTSSNLMGVDEIVANSNLENHDFKLQQNSPMELDLNGIDFGDILKSQAKQKSPRIISRCLRNYQAIENNINNYKKSHLSPEKIFRDNIDIEKLNLNFNFSQNNLDLKDEDIRHLFDNMQSQRFGYAERNVIDEDNSNQVSLVIVNSRDNLKIDQQESINFLTKEIEKNKMNNQNKSNNFVSADRNQNPSYNLQPQIQQSQFQDPLSTRIHFEFENMMRSQMNLYNLIREKCDEIESLKSQIIKLNSKMESFNYYNSITPNICSRCVNNNPNQINSNSPNVQQFVNNSSNKNKFKEGQIQLYTNEIKIVVASKNTNQHSPNEIISDIDDLNKMNLNFNMEDLCKSNFLDKNNKIIPSQTRANDFNSQNALTYDSTTSGFKIPLEKKRISNNLENNNIKDVQHINSGNSFPKEKVKNDDRKLNSPHNETYLKVNENINSRKDLITIKDDEFDQIFKNAKNRKNLDFSFKNDFANSFTSGNNLQPMRNSDEINSNPLKDLNNEEIDSSALDSYMMFNSKNDLKSLDDEEFDQILKNVKNKKKANNFAKNKKLASNFENRNELSNSNFNSFNQINNSTFQNTVADNDKNFDSEINIREVNDDEFDNMLKNLKKKKVNSSDFRNEFVKGNKLSNIHLNKNLLTEKANDQLATFTSDFMCNNNPITYKTNQKVLKLMSEMEQETGEELLANYESNEKIENGFDGKEETKFKQTYKKDKQNTNTSNTNQIIPEIGMKRNFVDHVKTLSRTPVNDANIDIISNNRNKKMKVGQGFKIDKKEGILNKDSNSNKTTTIKLNPATASTFILDNSTNNDQKSQTNLKLNEFTEKLKKIRESYHNYPVTLSNSEKFEFLCCCAEMIIENDSSINIFEDNSEKYLDTEIKNEIKSNFIKSCEKCKICEGKMIISIENFTKAFMNFYSGQNHNSMPSHNTNLNISSNSAKEKEIESFLKYQYRLATWKFYLISKISENKNSFCISKIFKHISTKYNLIFNLGKRSFLTKVSEKDSSINKYMTLLIIDIRKSRDIKNNNLENYTLELTDGYKSVFSEISSANPIFNLISRNLIFPGIKIHIGLAKIDKITDDFNVFVQIFYNSISKADFTSKLGVDKNKKFLIKNLSNLLDDGGEISLIDVIILKKYEYYVFDYNKKMKYSNSKFEKIVEQANEEVEKRQLISSYQEDANYEIEEDTNHKESTNRIIIKKKNNNSENLNEVKGLKNSRLREKNLNISNNPKNKKEEKNFTLVERKSPYEGISYNFKIVCVDSLLYFNFMNQIGNSKNSVNSLNSTNPNDQNFNWEFKKTLFTKQKLLKKCVIEFHLKKLNSYENLTQGNRYQLALLNVFKNSNQNSNYTFPHDPKILKLKGNDMVMINEVKLSCKKTDSIYQNFLNEMSIVTNTPLEDVEISEFLSKNNFDFSKMINEEVSFVGIYLNRFLSGNGNKNIYKNSNLQTEINPNPIQQKFLFFLTQDNNLAIIKIHDENFFDLSKFTNLKNQNSYQIFNFRSLNFQILYYFDYLGGKNLTTFKVDKLYDKNFANKYVVLYMETNSYSSFRIVNNGGKNVNELKKISAGKKPIYEESLLDEIVKSIS